MITDALAPLLRILARHGQRQFVAIVRKYQAHAEPGRDLRGMAPEARSGVDIETGRPDRQMLQRFRGHDRIMLHTPSRLNSQVQPGGFRLLDIRLCQLGGRFSSFAVKLLAQYLEFALMGANTQRPAFETQFAP